MSRLLKLMALFLLVSTGASARELHWTRLDVEARLDFEGVLHVTERHQMVFDGDWNGGERSFDIRARHRLHVDEIRRIADGTSIVLEGGGTDSVDQWARDGDVVRWRSREADDPPFSSQTLIYEIDYRITNILVRTGEGRFLLDHDFGFAARDGVIEAYSLNLTMDPPWITPQNPISLTREQIPPGESVELDVPLERNDGIAPAGVRTPPTFASRASVAGASALGALLLFLSYLSHERRTGRLDPVKEMTPDEARAELAAWKPEVLGAAWDENVGSAEVSAVLARLVAGKALETTVSKSKWGSPELEMKLLVPRSSLQGYDRELIDAFFVDGDATSTENIRDHYKSSGFNPAALIEPDILAILEKNRAWSGEAEAPVRWGLPFLFFLLAIGAAVAALILRNGEAGVPVAIGLGFSTVFILAFGSIAARASARKASLSTGWIIGWNVVPALWLLGWGALILSGAAELGLLELVLIGFTAFAIYNFISVLARTNLTPSRLAMRRRLLALRQWIEKQLATSDPALEDTWMPHVLALGLGTNADRWFRTFGPGSVGRVSSGGGGGSFGSGSGSSVGGSWSGGGTSFGGGGATGMWAAAAGGVAAGVSTSSSSSGGGGSSSSGGGGGGGW